MSYILNYDTTQLECDIAVLRGVLDTLGHPGAVAMVQNMIQALEEEQQYIKEVA